MFDELNWRQSVPNLRYISYSCVCVCVIWKADQGEREWETETNICNIQGRSGQTQETRPQSRSVTWVTRTKPSQEAAPVLNSGIPTEGHRSCKGCLKPEPALTARQVQTNTIVSQDLVGVACAPQRADSLTELTQDMALKQSAPLKTGLWLGAPSKLYSCIFAVLSFPFGGQPHLPASSKERE